jgi:hypothetical protein
VIRNAGIDHGHEADGARVHDRERDDGFLAEHENVERIVVFCERPGNEAVVGGIKDGRVKDAVHANNAALLVELVLDVCVQWNFDDSLELVRHFVTGTQVVPGMCHRNLVRHGETAGRLYYLRHS